MVAAAVIGAGALAAGASVYSGSKQAGAAKDAANAARDQNAQTRADMAPWRAAGLPALGQIADMMGTSGNTSAANYGSFNHQFNADDLKTNLAPNYQFQLQQGLGAATNAGNAAGFSGNTLKGINDYAQGYAGNAYQQAFSNYTANQTNIYNRLSNLAGLGQTANQVTGALGAQNTQNAGNFATSGAAASAAGVVGASNALGNAASNYAGWNYLNGGGYKPTSGYDYASNGGFTSASNSGFQGDADFYSDARLKTDIAQIGRADSGLPIYSYRYKAGGPTHIGVMAQDVERVAPEAVSHDAAGFKKVRYAMLKDIGHAD